jgi:hypothetical protein
VYESSSVDIWHSHIFCGKACQFFLSDKQQNT